jgi:DNA-binding SARP family transcriptional activator
VRFGVLGPLQVTREGQPIAVGGARARAVLVMLLADAGRVVPAERLADALWPALDRDRGVANLQVRMAGRCGQPEPLTASSPCLRVIASTRRLTRSTCCASRGSLAPGVMRSRAVSRQRQRRSCPKLLACGEGLRLPISTAWTPRWRSVRLEEARLDAIELRIDALLASGRHAETVGEAEALTERHPLRERFWWQRMLALYRSGRQADALRAYRELRGILADQLGIEPSPELRALEARMLRQEDDLRYRPASARAAAAPQTRYVDSGGVHIAYQVIGEGERDIVFVPRLLSHLDQLWEDEDTAVFSPIPIASVP